MRVGRKEVQSDGVWDFWVKLVRLIQDSCYGWVLGARAGAFMNGASVR